MIGAKSVAAHWDASREMRAVVGGLGLVLPLLIAAVVVSQFLSIAQERIVTVFLINVIAVISIGVFTGNSGILSFGHVSFMALGAYLSGLFTIPVAQKAMLLPNLPTFLGETEMGMFPAMLLAMALVAVVAVFVGLPISRMGGAAAVISTLGFLIIIDRVIIGARDFTRGSNVFIGVPRETTLWIVMAWVVIVILAARLFRDSVPGVQLRATRDDELAASSSGINISLHRLGAWVLSAVLMTISGALLGHFLGAFSPTKFYMDETFALLAMLIIGGMSTVTGAIGGTIIVTLAIELLRRLEGGFDLFGLQVPEAFGLTTIGLALMILFVMYRRPAGLLGTREWDEILFRRRVRRDKSVEVEDLSPLRVERDGALSLEGAVKTFGGLRALDDVDLSLKPGEIVGLIGPNGSGKTTLLNLISGALRMTSGSVEIDGAEATDWPAHRIARHGVSRTFQNIRLFGSFTVRENIEIGAMAHWPRRGGKLSDAMIEAILSSMSLTEEAERGATTLAYGAQRRLEIARALALRPRYLLLDEPAAGMNPAESDALLSDLAILRAENRIGLLIVDHDLRLIMRLCDRVIVLNKGQVIAEGTPDEVQRHPDVIEAYLGRGHRHREAT